MVGETKNGSLMSARQSAGGWSLSEDGLSVSVLCVFVDLSRVLKANGPFSVLFSDPKSVFTLTHKPSGILYLRAFL